MTLYFGLTIVIIFVFLLSLFKKTSIIRMQWKGIFFAAFLTGILFVLSDLIFLKKPAEKWLFIFVCPIVLLPFYERIKRGLPLGKLILPTYYFSFVFTVTAFFLAFFYRNNNYAFWIFTISGMCNWIVYFAYTPRWYPYFITTFLCLLFPVIFISYLLISYNTLQNSEIQLLLTYLEVIFYCFLFFLVSVISYESYKAKK